MVKKKQSKLDGVRLQKLLAQAGVASRRGAEALILQGKISVNGKVITEMGCRADPETDVIEVDGVPIEQEEILGKRVTILMNKPRGVMCTANDPEGRETIFDILDEDLPRLFSVGRLDYNTEGAILLTNDGTMANRLTHPRFHVAKTYHVKIQGKLSHDSIKALRTGVVIEGKRTLPADVTELGSLEKNIWYEVVLIEGRNRQIHKMMEAVGARVSRLKRVQFGNLTLDGVKVGSWRPLSGRELDGLLTGAPAISSPAPPQPRRAASDNKKPGKRGSASKGRAGSREKTTNTRHENSARNPNEQASRSRRKPGGYSRGKDS